MNTIAAAELASNLEFGPVELNVSDLDNTSQFYQQILQFKRLDHTTTTHTLGHQSPLLTLHHQPTLPSPSPRDAGLFHIAIRYESQGSLAQTLKSVLTNAPQHFSGSGDHLVSQAFYLTDPEGNGIEIYHDRPRDQWEWLNGQIKMDTLYIDPLQFIEKHKNQQKSIKAHVGHVHLKVGNIPEAHTFYVDVLGFNRTAHMQNALFVSVGGYHHHLGFNTWQSSDSPPRKETLGLKKINFILPKQHELESLKKRLDTNGIEFESTPNSLNLFDPWKNAIEFHSSS